jgi:hypothetical protein
VNADIPIPHREVTIDAMPGNPNVLVGTSAVDTRILLSPAVYGPDGSVRKAAAYFNLLSSRVAPQDGVDAVYITTDGGKSWHGHLLSPGTSGGGDPFVAAGRNGTLLASYLGASQQQNLLVARSTDRGATWSFGSAINHPGMSDIDHDQMAIDQSQSRFRGRAYIDVLGGTKWGARSLALFYSADDGRTWQGPQIFQGSNALSYYQVYRPFTLSDGTLVLPYLGWSYIPNPKAPYVYVDINAWLAMSLNGGLTFTPRRLAYHQHNVPFTAGGVTYPSFAADRSGLHRDRIYLAWEGNFSREFLQVDRKGNFSGKFFRVFVCYSDNRGRTWSRPVVVDPKEPAKTTQWYPFLTVNKDGTVGISWFAARPDRVALADPHDPYPTVDEYFSASIDGGKTFLPAIRLSDSVRRKLLAHGDTSGDYSGIVADAASRFHPFWASSGEVYTTSIRVITK